MDTAIIAANYVRVRSTPAAIVVDPFFLLLLLLLLLLPVLLLRPGIFRKCPKAALTTPGAVVSSGSPQTEN